MVRKPPPQTKKSIATRFKKGVSGNPAGKPVGTRDATTIVREAFDTIVGTDPDRLNKLNEYYRLKHGRPMTAREELLYGMLYKAIKQLDVPAARLMLQIESGGKIGGDTGPVGNIDQPSEMTKEDVERALLTWSDRIKNVTPKK